MSESGQTPTLEGRRAIAIGHILVNEHDSLAGVRSNIVAMHHDATQRSVSN